MTKGFLGVLAFLAVAAIDASAQGVDLTGRYLCVQMCREGLVGQPAFVTQNGREMNLLNEAGEPSRAWVDWAGRTLGAELERRRDLFPRRHADSVRPWHRLAARPP